MRMKYEQWAGLIEVPSKEEVEANHDCHLSTKGACAGCEYLVK